MAYMIGGKNIYDLSEVVPTSDPRSSTGFSTTNLFTYGGKSFQELCDQKIAMATSGYMYDNDVNNGKYKPAGFFLLARRGWRPFPSYTRRRWQSSSSGTYYLTKFDDGEVWVSTTALSRSGTRIGTASEDMHFLYVVQISGGGGGAGGNGTQSGGGGGGGAWAYHCIRLYPNMNYRIVIHGGGSGGGRNTNGGSSGGCAFELYRSTDYSSSAVYSYWLYGGSGGGLQSGGAGGQIGSYNPSSSDTYIQNLEKKTGASGGANRSNGSSNSSVYRTPAYNPEGLTLDYGQANGGTGNLGGGGGAGWYYGHNGGKGGAGGEDGSTGGTGAGGGGGAYVIFAGRSGAAGGNSYIGLFY